MKLALFMTILLSCTAFASTNETKTVHTSGQSHHHQKKNPFTLEFVLASEQTKNSNNEVDGTYNKIDTSFMYSHNENNDLRFFVSSDYVTNEERDEVFTWDLAEIMYRRKNILNEKDHFVTMNFELKNYRLLDSERMELYKFDGAFIPQAIFKKKLSRYSGVELKLRRHFYERNTKTASALSKEDRIYFTPWWMPNHSFILSTQFTYKKKMRAGDYFSYRSFSMRRATNERLYIHPGVMYFFSRKIMGEFYIESILNDSEDKRATADLIKDELVLGGALYVVAF